MIHDQNRYKIVTPDEVLGEVVLKIEHKNFTLTKRRNRRGDFYRIVEECNVGLKVRRNVIIIPVDGMELFMTSLMKIQQ
jgi:hypothetical protein